MHSIRHMKSSTFASKSLYGGNSLVGHSKINSGVEPKLDMSDLIDSNSISSCNQFYMKRPTFELGLSYNLQLQCNNQTYVFHDHFESTLYQNYPLPSWFNKVRRLLVKARKALFHWLNMRL